MTTIRRALQTYSADVVPLSQAQSTTEPSYYPAIRSLLIAVLRELGLPTDVRINTTHRRRGGGHDVPDVALFDGAGDFVIVSGEVKGPTPSLEDMAVSVDQNNQVGRYLAQTRVVILSNVRGFGLLTVEPGYNVAGPVPPANRVLEQVVELWPSSGSFRRGAAINTDAAEEIAELVEAAVTKYAPIAEPETLARVLARQARRAKNGLPERFSRAVGALAEDFGNALGITFNGAEGEEFFRSSMIQTVYYGLFAGWLLWTRERDQGPFNWRDLPEYIRIPFLGELFHEIQHPRRIAELGLGPRLDLAAETLGRVDRDLFFARLRLPNLGGNGDPEQAAATAIVYFYEPFLETFDPDLRKELGVWYTPPEIVRYQVARVDKLLRMELGCDRGFADDRVIVLDPACGTGAYLIEVLHQMAETLRAEGVQAELGDTLLQAVRQRVLGFEILTAPFVIAHLQLHLILASLGAEPGPGERPGVYLTNALTGWGEEAQIPLHFPELQEEHDAAYRVKAEAPIIVVIGNPPYNRFAGAPAAEERTLVDGYKGIQRDDRGRVMGASALYTRWGIRKHLLDDLYLRFFSIAEDRIGRRAAYGVVSYITNNSYLTGRSHPLMRESLLTNFHAVWIDNLHGNRLASERTPTGTSCETVFNIEGGSSGIKVGTAISTLLKRPQPATAPGETPIWVRDFWGRAGSKRAALLESLDIANWVPERLAAACNELAGPRQYEQFFSSEERRWKLLPYDASGGYDEWLSLDELFPQHFQGVNPNRGLQGTVIDYDQAVLARRMRDFYSDLPFEEIQRRYPSLCERFAGYDALQVRQALQDVRYSADRVVRYSLFPLDGRYLYYETRARMLNRARPELWQNLPENEFLIAVPEPRRTSEARPLFAANAFDLHLHDRGSVGFPADIRHDAVDEDHGQGNLFAEEPAEPGPLIANLSEDFWIAVADAWGMDGGLHGGAARQFVRRLFRACLALCHAPEYQVDHAESLAQEWARVPVPRDPTLFDELATVGDTIAVLLDPFADAREVLQELLGTTQRGLAVLASDAGGPVRERDLQVTISYFGGARGRWKARPYEETEPSSPWLGGTTGDLYINETVFFRNVPLRVWTYELGGYPVLKKWLGYRHFRSREGGYLSLREKDTFRGLVHRISALLILTPRLNGLYERASANAWTVDLQPQERVPDENQLGIFPVDPAPADP